MRNLRNMCSALSRVHSALHLPRGAQHEARAVDRSVLPELQEERGDAPESDLERSASSGEARGAGKVVYTPFLTV